MLSPRGETVARIASDILPRNAVSYSMDNMGERSARNAVYLAEKLMDHVEKNERNTT